MVLEYLERIKIIMEELNYEVELDLISDNKSADALYLNLKEDCELDQDLIITVYPYEDDLDGSVFIQFFSQYKVDVQKIDDIYIKCNEINRTVVLGNFNISENGENIYYKYMLALNKESKMSAEFIADIIDMNLDAVERFSNVLAS
ncbi:MAG: YbjN domain-containing protein [Campylobacteraceae bacterium]|nr:YbjN domain-containing protein [Campylobacteraceae bacterium]